MFFLRKEDSVTMKILEKRIYLRHIDKDSYVYEEGCKVYMAG